MGLVECCVWGLEGTYSGGSKNESGMLAKKAVWLPGLQYAFAGWAKWVTG